MNLHARRRRTVRRRMGTSPGGDDAVVVRCLVWETNAEETICGMICGWYFIPLGVK